MVVDNTDHVAEELLADLNALKRRIQEFEQANGSEGRLDLLSDGASLRQAILESSLDCIVTIDSDGLIMEFNPAAEVTFGYILRLWTQWEDNSTHHSLPYSAITLQIDCLGRFLKLCALRKRNMCVKVSDMVIPPITGLCITFGTYMEALGNMCVKVSDTALPPITGLCITFGTYMCVKVSDMDSCVEAHYICYNLNLTAGQPLHKYHPGTLYWSTYHHPYKQHPEAGLFPSIYNALKDWS